ncbi:helix-turn-helix transcriptional regulator [Streptomyces zagrosensis]|uniref:Putative DNA-binding transcriptional regulator YafY n=1 Tax=Streptomyces zagrosensis TaxID=1042984 RepID=A0A7W9V3I4_9ACTN|nr:WYL domain-containing protein [Streptomyces zagrosensis]MBB5939929.1 putative DNA-binding transcriptional regulator YafY [Streptomyces zagrosensis]
MAETSARLLLLLSLFQSRREWSGTALAQRLEVSSRTLRRDIDRLRQLGYPVRVSRGPGGAYRLDAGTRLPPLLFDDDQAIAVAVALQTAPTTVVGIEEAAARALATVRQVMPTHLRHRIDAVHVTSIGNAWDFAAPPIDSPLLLALGTAVHDGAVLVLDYASAADPPEDESAAPRRSSARRLEPHRLAVWSGRWYLVAWDVERREWGAFRADRITLGPPTGVRFSPREMPSADLTTFITGELDRGDAPGHWPCRGEVLLDAPAAVVARWAPGGAMVEEVTANRCRLTLGAWSWTGLAALIGTFASDIEVVGPPELAAACGRLARRYAAASRSMTGHETGLDAPGAAPGARWAGSAHGA